MGLSRTKHWTVGGVIVHDAGTVTCSTISSSTEKGGVIPTVNVNVAAVTTATTTTMALQPNFESHTQFFIPIFLGEFVSGLHFVLDKLFYAGNHTDASSFRL
jgi:hypothetical protein